MEVSRLFRRQSRSPLSDDERQLALLNERLGALDALIGSQSTPLDRTLRTGMRQ